MISQKEPDKPHGHALPNRGDADYEREREADHLLSHDRSSDVESPRLSQEETGQDRRYPRHEEVAVAPERPSLQRKPSAKKAASPSAGLIVFILGVIAVISVGSYFAFTKWKKTNESLTSASGKAPAPASASGKVQPRKAYGRPCLIVGYGDSGIKEIPFRRNHSSNHYYWDPKPLKKNRDPSLPQYSLAILPPTAGQPWWRLQTNADAPDGSCVTTKIIMYTNDTAGIPFQYTLVSERGKVMKGTAPPLTGWKRMWVAKKPVNLDECDSDSRWPTDIRIEYKDKKALNCKEGHGLKKFYPQEEFSCSVCHMVRHRQEETAMHGCRKCNYDACDYCYQRSFQGFP